MRDLRWILAAGMGMGLSLWVAGCGSGGSTTTPPLQRTTPTVTVTPSASSITTAQALTVTVTVSGSSSTPTGTVTLTSGTYTSAASTLSAGGASIVVAAGSLAAGADTLTVTYTPDSASAENYYGASGTSPVTVTAVAKITPTVTVTPSAGSITTAQQITVTVALSVPSGDAAPTGTVTLTCGSYTSAATTLEGSPSSAPIIIPAGSLAVGSDTLTVSYGPDAASSATYTSATGTAPVTVAKATPTVTVTPSSFSITTAQALAVTVAVSDGNPTPTGSVTVTSGSYTSAAATLSGGSATINIPAGSLAVGSDTLTASYTPDAASSSIYNSASGTSSAVTVNQAYVLTVNSTNPSSGVSISVNLNPMTPLEYLATTSFTVAGQAGQVIGLSAPASASGNNFSSWAGCTSTSTVICNVTLNGNTTVTANYTTSAVAVLPNPATATIGGQLQFSAKINGTASSAITWSVAAPSGSSLGPGDISASGLYTTPYPAPATVTVTATSTQGATKGATGSVTVTLSPPATASGPALTVDTGNQTHAISPYIYGMNYYTGSSDAAAAASISLPIDRWGGNEATSYNYLNDVQGKGDDWYFENFPGSSPASTNPPTVSSFNTTVGNDAAVGAKTLGTVPIIGWVPAANSACSFSVTKYGAQQAVDPYRTDCGNGVLTNGAKVVNDPTDTYYQVTPATFDAAWVSFLVNKFGNAANGGVAIYELDNEPSWWDGVHIDVHPLPFTYDEVTNTSIATAEAVKTADPTAGVSGPVMDYWWDYFYSKKDVESGWGSGGGPCWEPWSNPVDRKAHGGVPFIEYYLQQFAAASNTYGARLLDYLDLHTYYAATYNGNGVGSTTAGDTGAQEARLNSTRVFWDPTYTDPNEPQPNYITDSDYTASCNTPLQAPQLIPMAQGWVAKDYPGTKVAFTEYSWGGQESISGALAQADILGIFGKYGLDIATLWGSPDPTTQIPGLMAYNIYRNYDGNKSMFGDTALASASVNQGLLSVYGALRASDSAVTVVVINKTYGDLTSTLSLAGLPSTATSAQAYLYSNANLNAIVAQPAVTVTPPASGGTVSTIGNYTFPAQSITLFVVPQ